MTNLSNTYIVNNNIYSIGPSNCGYNFVKLFLTKKNNIKSFLDIGCGNGMTLDLMNKEVDYLGVDANVGIYKKKKNIKIKYFKNAHKTELYLNSHKKKYNCVALMDVLEHTDTFLKLFTIGLNKSNDYVVVGLPNEDYIISRLKFLFGGGITSHGLETIHYKPGHKHQWLIQYKIASKLLEKHSKKYKFKLEYTSFYINQPKSFLKRFIYKIGLFFLPLHLQTNNFCMVFKKIK